MTRAMEISTYLLLTSLLNLAVTMVVQGQNQTGFISLDCGLGYNASYIDARTGLYYTSDAPSYIESGVNNTISPDLKSSLVDQQFHFLRSFPQGTRNCYTLTPAEGKGQTYLIRARFMYGNYDSKDKLPEFDLHLGVELWDTVSFNGTSIPVSKEIIHLSLSDYIPVCLVNTGYGTPFISALELRPLNNSMYISSQNPQDLNLISRLDFGSLDNQLIRYGDDMYDRIWQPFGSNYCHNCKILSTNRTGNIMSLGSFDLPYAVMRTAFIPDNSSEPIRISLEPDNSTDNYILCYHFAEIELLQSGIRNFRIYMNGSPSSSLIEPLYLEAYTVYRRLRRSDTMAQKNFEITIKMEENSTLPPLINAMEIYRMKEFHRSQTHDIDVAAILKIKAMYEVTRNWNGDPCAPKSYVWNGLGCNYSGLDPPRVTSMNMSASSLKGSIAPYIANLTMLSSLDLSQNNLTGEVPAFLAGLAFLRVLNLKGNNFTGSIPPELIAKSKIGFLSLSVDGDELGNTDHCVTTPCKKSNFVVPIVAAVAAFLLILLVALAVFWFVKRRRGKGVGAEKNKIGEPLKTKNRQFTFLEIQNMTNNFQRVVGKGGFGTVYHGYVGETQVAVKMLSTSSSQGYKEFVAEVNLLINVHHKNLTSLVGYCNQATHIGLVYEYMANGNLEKHLSVKNPYVLSWKHRLRIAVDAAQGLEYLHCGCKPAIVHRDVKTTNILLDDNFQAKLSDFGLSRVFSVESDTHVSTAVAGTPGYLDPEYYTSNRLTEKSDVYSFGVVLLKMITSRPAIERRQDETNHIVNWASSVVADGDVRKIADPRFRGDFDVNSVWKAVELAMACVSPKSSERPTMNHVVMELKECFATEVARQETGEDDSIREITTNLDTGLGLLPR